MPSTTLATRTTDRIPPRLSTGSVVSLTWAGTSSTASTKATTASGSVSRNTDPHQNSSSRAPAVSGPSAEIPPPSADQRAIDFVRAGPDHSAVIRASVVGYAMPAASPPSTRAPISTSTDGAQAASRHAGTERTTPEQQHHLAPVAIAERAQVEHGRGEAERVADGHQVELRLRGVERLADVGERHVGDGEVEVGDGRHEDQRAEHQTLAGRDSWRARPRRRSRSGRSRWARARSGTARVGRSRGRTRAG